MDVTRRILDCTAVIHMHKHSGGMTHAGGSDACMGSKACPRPRQLERASSTRPQHCSKLHSMSQSERMGPMSMRPHRSSDSTTTYHNAKIITIITTTALQVHRALA